MYKFSRVAQSALNKAGYQPGRKIYVKDYKIMLEHNKYEAFDRVLIFAEEFGNLFIPTHNIGTIELDLTAALNYVAPEWIHEDYLQRIGEPLSPFGKWQGNVLLMTKQGTVYGAMDNHLEYMGQSGEEMIDALCRNDQSQFKVLPDLQ